MNYIKIKQDGSTEATSSKPVFGEVSTSSDYFLNGKWHNSTGTEYTEQFTYLSKDGKLLGVEVANGQPVDLHYTEDAPSIVEDCIQSDVMISDEYKGKNACTAWVNFDGTTTPPTIRDSFNVSSVIRTSTGIYDVYFDDIMKNINYCTAGASSFNGVIASDVLNIPLAGKYIDRFEVQNVRHNDASAEQGINADNISIQVFGGKN